MNDFDDVISAASEQYQLPAALLKGLIRQESDFNPKARSDKGAFGLAQFMPKTAEEVGVDPADPVQSIFGAAYYLKKQIEKFGSIDKGLAAYNWGQGNLKAAIDEYGDDWVNKAPDETKKYLSSIADHVATYSNDFKRSTEPEPSAPMPPPAASNPFDHGAAGRTTKTVDEGPDRTWVEFGADSVKDLVQGTGQLASGIAWLARKGVVDPIGRAVEGDDYRSNTDFEDAARGAGEIIAEGKSEKDRWQQAQIKKLNDDPELQSGFLDTMEFLVKNPTAAFSSMLQSAPGTLATGMVGGKVATAIGERVMGKALAAGPITPEMSAAAKELATKAAERGAGWAAGSAEALQSLGQIGQSVEQKLDAAGVTDPEQRANALRLAIPAAISTLLGGRFVGGATEARMFANKTLQRAGETAVGGVAKSVVRESLEEGVQNIGEQTFQNLGEAEGTRTNEPLSKGVGASVAMGMAVGGLQGGGSTLVGRAMDRLTDPATPVKAADAVMATADVAEAAKTVAELLQQTSVTGNAPTYDPRIDTTAIIPEDNLDEQQRTINEVFGKSLGTDGIATLNGVPVRAIPESAMPDAGTIEGDGRVTADGARALRSLFDAVGTKVIFYEDDGKLVDGFAHPLAPDTIFLSNNPQRAADFVARHEVKHTLETVTAPDGRSYGDVLLEMAGVGITDEGMRQTRRFASTAPAGASAAQLKAHYLNELLADTFADVSKTKSFVGRAFDYVKAKYGQNVAVDFLSKTIDAFDAAFVKVQALFGGSKIAESKAWFSNADEIHGVMAQMLGDKIGQTAVARSQKTVTAPTTPTATQSWTAEREQEINELQAKAREMGKNLTDDNIAEYDTLINRAEDLMDERAAITGKPRYSPKAFEDLKIRKQTEDIRVQAASAFADNPFDIESGVHRVNFSDVTLQGNPDKTRVSRLAERIKLTKSITPLLVARRSDGTQYLAEGQHRARALQQLGYTSFPARVVSERGAPQFSPKELGPKWSEVQRESARSAAVDRAVGVREDEAPRPRVQPRLTSLLDKLYRGKIDEQQLAAGVEELTRELIERTEDGKLIKRPRQRGADLFREKILNAKRNGDISAQEAELADWLARHNSALFDDVALSIRTPNDTGRGSGTYRPVSRLITLFKNVNANDTRTIHEVMHHTERMMPYDVATPIRLEYLSQLGEQAKIATGRRREMFEAIFELHMDPTEANAKKAVALMGGKEDYQYLNPSEFWAVRGADILAARIKVKDSGFMRIAQWTRELWQKIRNLLGLPSDAPLIRALDGILKGDGKFVSDKMLFTQASAYGDREAQVNSPEFKRWFGDSKVVDAEGKPLVVYHGTTHDFSIFKSNRANLNNNFGKGFYASNMPDDVSENYAGEGPDLTSRIELLAERIAQDNDWSYDDPRAKDNARKKLSGGSPNIMPLYLRIENPLVLGGDDETFVGDREIKKFVNYIARASEDVARFPEVAKALESLEMTKYDGGAWAKEVVNLAKRASVYAENNNGDLIGSEIVRKAIESAGYDGIIDHTVSDKFGATSGRITPMVGVDENTTHYIVFSPEQIKSAVGNNGQFDANNPDIRYSPKMAIDLMSKPPARDNMTIDEVAQMFDKLVGGQKDYTDPAARKVAMKQAVAEYSHQMAQRSSGEDWYDADTRQAFDITSEHIPYLKEGRQPMLFALIAGIHSQQTKVMGNWPEAGANYQHYLREGAFSPVNPDNGRYWATSSGPNKSKQLEMVNAMVGSMGEDGFLDWMYSVHPVSELNEARATYGNMSPGVSGKASDLRMGVDVFGPKVSEFIKNLNGIDGVTVDKWMTRTFNRWFGRMADKNGVIIDAPTDPERRAITGMVNDIAVKYGVTPQSVQAALWYFEQDLFKHFGASGEAHGFSDAAKAYYEQETGRKYESGVVSRSGRSGVSEAAQGDADDIQFSPKVNFEVAPDPTDKKASSRWAKLSEVQKFSISERVARRVVPSYLDAVGADGDLMSQIGSYLDHTNPSFVLSVTKGDPVQIAKDLGYGLSQESMMLVSDKPIAGGEQRGAVDIELGPKTPAEIAEIYATLRAARPGENNPISGQSYSDGYMTVLNYSDLSTDALAEVIGNALGNKYNVLSHEVYASLIEKKDYGHDDTQSNTGRDSEAVRFREGTVRRRVAEAIGDEFARSGGQFSPRDDGRSYGAGNTEFGSGRAGAVQARKPGEVSGTGVHYSKAERKALTASYFGTGYKGAELTRVREATDPRIQQRIYFYVNDGRGINRESGVGPYAHKAQLSNIYDAGADSLDLWPGRTPNEFESAVLDAGFDGYTVPGRGAAVLLGPRTIKVEPLGIGVTPTVDRIEQAEPSAYRQAARAVAEDRTIPSGEMTGAQWKARFPERDLRHLKDNESYYKEKLVPPPARVTVESIPKGFLKRIQVKMPIMEKDGSVTMEDRSAKAALESISKQEEAYKALRACIG